jgi:single-strand DNA-binding protein
MNYNKVFLLGRLVNDIELKATNSGHNVASFSLATSRVFKDKAGNKQEQAQFHKCIAWNRTSEVLSQYAVKGQELFIAGRLENRSWEDKQGVKKYATEVMVEEMQLGQKPKGYDNGPKNGPDDKPAPKAQGDDEDIPIIEDEKESGEDFEKESKEKTVKSGKQKVLEADDIDVKDIPF